VKHFLDLRWHLAEATSPFFADALIAMAIAGTVTELLKFLFE
jgi:hypothetical protein